MRILFDTNVILDHLLNRQPHALSASRLIEYVVQRRLDGILCATTLTTIYYVVSKELGDLQARTHISALLWLLDIAPVDKSVLTDAFNLNFTDYEDAVLHESATHAGVEAIVTRNQRDFRNARLQIYSPEELLRVV